MRPSLLLLAALALPLAATADHLTAQEVTVKKATPIMTVEEIEPCLSFWTERLGFEVTATVPHEDRMGFAMLQGGNVELMYQSRASVEADLGTKDPELASRMADGMTTLFIEVDALDPIVEAMEGAEIAVPRRQTFYGMDEIFVRAPCGTLIGFAAPVEGGQD